MALDGYRLALRTPSVGRLLGTSLVARMPNGMSSLAILLLVTRHHGYARAGLVSALYVAAAGASNLVLARAVDRVGARRVLVPAAIGYATCMVVLALVPGDDYLLELVVAAGAGLTSPPVVAVVRGLWPQLLEPEVAQAVYGLEATAQELIFMAGPALVALLAGLASPPVAVAATGLIALSGTVAFAITPVLATPVTRAAKVRRRLLRGSRLPAYVAVGVAITIAFNMTDIAVVAFVSGRHASAGAGVVLAVWSLGSLVGGLWFGAGAARVDDAAVVRATALIAGGVAVAALAPGNIGLGVIMFAGGAAIAPGLARLYTRVGAVAPEGAATEAFGWMTVGLLAGSSIGAALGGITVDALGARACFLLAAAAPALTAAGLFGWLHRRKSADLVEQPLAS